MMSQGENCLLKMPIFSGKVVDFRLNYSILKENDKNTISGSNAFLPVFTHAVKKSSSCGTLNLTACFCPFGKTGDVH
jgi:hypothetical protein